MTAGRSCPLDYRYEPGALRALPAVRTQALYVVGGLYGNTAALAAVLRLFDAETQDKHLIFNGDFNWFNISPEAFHRINQAVLQHDAIRGNVETELARTGEESGEADCGCAYPEWVEGETVERSNLIMKKLARTAAAFPDLQRQLQALPMFRRFEVGGLPVAVVHGDAASLAGWGFSVERMADNMHLQEVSRWFDAADARLFACSHTCSPVFREVFDGQGRSCLVANNGAAGMPNFAGMPAGLLTRIATTPCDAGLPAWRRKLQGVYVDALPIPYDDAAWQAEFIAQWPAGSPAHASYWRRIQAKEGLEGDCLG